MAGEYRGSHMSIQSLVEPAIRWCTNPKRTYAICTLGWRTYRGTWQEGAWQVQIGV